MFVEKIMRDADRTSIIIGQITVVSLVSVLSKIVTGCKDLEGGVINESLHQVLMVASTPVIMRGNTHDIPIIVHTCVSEIVNRGKLLHHPRMFINDNKLFSPRRFR